jgi:flagellin
MSLGVLNNISAIYSENNLNNTTNSLSKTLQQLSSGSKINSGADDAAGLSLVDGLQANSQALAQSQTNATEGVGLLQVADGALSQVTSLLNRAVTLATEASNGTLNGSQDTAANQEYQSILSEISNIGSTTTYNQQGVFGTNTNIYTGDSTAAGASVNDLNIRSLSSSNLGDSGGQMSYTTGSSNVFIDLSKGGTNAAATDALGASSATTSITVSYMANAANGSPTLSTATISVGYGTAYSNTADGLISAINNEGANLGISASFGTAKEAGTAGTDASTEAETTAGGTAADTGIIISGANIGAISSNTSGANGTGEIGQLKLADATVAHNVDATKLSGIMAVTDSTGAVHDITLGTTGTTDTMSDLASTITNGGYGITATYTAGSAGAGNGASLVFTSTSSKASIAETNSPVGAADTAAGDTGDTVTATLSDQPTASGTTQTTTLGTISTDTASDVIAFGTGASEGSYTLSGTVSTDVAAINKGDYGVTATANALGTAFTLTSSNSKLTAALTTDVATVYTASGATVGQYYSTGIGGTVGDVATGGGTPNIGMTANTDGAGGTATIGYADQAGQSLSTTDLSNQTDAQSALTNLNKAIIDVAAQDGYLGAQINQLNAATQVLATQSENVTAAQNAVQATDYASATSNMSKYEILSQTGISALAQANSMQQEVTKLLQ